MKKLGASNTDQAKIAKYFEAGYKAAEIGEMLFIHVDVVNRFKPEKQKASKKKSAERNKKAQEEHDEIMSKKKG